jgi:hypothetical protein
MVFHLAKVRQVYSGKKHEKAADVNVPPHDGFGPLLAFHEGSTAGVEN